MSRVLTNVAISVFFLLAICGGIPVSSVVSAAPAPPSPQGAPAACTLPTSIPNGQSYEQTAWLLFVAANCQVNGQLGWEGWTEQTCWTAPSTQGCGPNLTAAERVRTRHLHGSVLNRVETSGRAAAIKSVSPLAGACGSMTTSANASPALKPFVPANLAAGAKFCEEVFVDTSESGFITSNALMTLSGQLKWSGSTGKTTIDMPTPSVEIKADWLPAASLKTPFTCAKPPAGVYVETINSVCYALVGCTSIRSY